MLLGAGLNDEIDLLEALSSRPGLEPSDIDFYIAFHDVRNPLAFLVDLMGASRP